MGIYFRRSRKVGPFRITLSKRGISTSIGSKHLRLTRGPRGTYVSGHIAGVTIRERIDATHKLAASPSNPESTEHAIPPAEAANASPKSKRRLLPGFLFVIGFIGLSAIVSHSSIEALPVMNVLLGVYLIGGLFYLACRSRKKTNVQAPK